MRTKSILTTAAIALVASLGSASAAEVSAPPPTAAPTEFEYLTGIQAIPLNTHEMASIEGRRWLRYNRKNGSIFVGRMPHGEVDAHGAICFAGGAPVFLPMGDGLQVTTSNIAMTCAGW